MATHLVWAFSLWRGYHTSGIAIESQEKLENIARKWIARIERDGFCIPSLGDKSDESEDLTGKDWQKGPILLTLLAMAADITGEKKWQELGAPEQRHMQKSGLLDLRVIVRHGGRPHDRARAAYVVGVVAFVDGRAAGSKGFGQFIMSQVRP